MSEQISGSAPAPLTLPENPSLEWLRKQAKRRLVELRAKNPAARLADALSWARATPRCWARCRAVNSAPDCTK